jgi:hypothetical protein
MSEIHSRCFGIMGGHGNFAFNLVVKVSVEVGYVFLSLRLEIASMSSACCQFYYFAIEESSDIAGNSAT